MKDVDAELIRRAAGTGGLVDLAEVRAVGLTAWQWQHRVRSGAWVPVAPGVWRPVTSTENFTMRVRAFSRSLGPEAALSGAAAAAWWGLDGFDRDQEKVVFTVPRSARWRRSLPVRTTDDWRLTDLLRHDGVRLFSVSRLILDLAAAGEPARRIESAIDSGIRLRLTSVATLRQRIGEASNEGRRGIRLLRELMLDSGGESALERRFLRVVRAAGLPRPRPQVAGVRESGRAMRVDFEFPNGLVAEVSGRLGHTSDRDRQREVRRRNALSAQGRNYVEFTTADVVEDPAYVVASLRAAISG